MLRLAALLVLIPAGAALAAAAYRPLAPSVVACAPGYHTDRGGNCQPDVAQENRYCPAGLVFQPTFDGWSCDPPPPQAY